MSDSVMIDVSGLAGHEMREGDGAAACLGHDGMFQMLVKGVRITTSEAGNTVFNCTFVVQDEDEKGKVLYLAFPVTGKVSSGPNEGQANIRQLGDLLVSTGRDPSYLQQIASQKQFDAKTIIAGLMTEGHNLCYARVNAWWNDYNPPGRPESRPKFFVTAKKYQEAKASGANWRIAHNVGRSNKTADNGVRKTTAASPSDELIGAV